MPKKVQEIVEEQIARWHAEQRRRAKVPPAQLVRPNGIAIAHAIGSFGVGVGQFAGPLLGIPVFDRAVLQHVAETARVRLETVQTLDEKAQSFIDDYVCALVRERNIGQDDYVRLLVRTVTALWAHGPAVLVGHGCVHIAPREHVLTVRTVAPLAVRVRRVARAYQLTASQARRKIRDTDRDRAAFHRRFFDADVDAAAPYDLILNTGGMSVLGAAHIVVEAYRQKFPAEARLGLAATG